MHQVKRGNYFTLAWFPCVINLRFAREVELILLEHVDIIKTPERQAVFAMLYSYDKKDASFQKWILKIDVSFKCSIKTIFVFISEDLCIFLNCCLCLILDHSV